MLTRTKYGAQRTLVDGWLFDSKAEARRYSQLYLLGIAGEITDLELQPKFDITIYSQASIEGCHGIVVGTHRADFAYRDKQGVLHVEDVKGFDHSFGRFRRRCVEAQFGITIELIR